MSHLSTDYLDEEMLLSSSGEDIEFALELIEAFQVSTSDSLRRFEDAVNEGRWSDAALHSHSMKGSAKTMGLNEFGVDCAGLEYWCRNEPTAPRPVSVVALQTSHKNAMAALADFAQRQSV